MTSTETPTICYSIGYILDDDNTICVTIYTMRQKKKLKETPYAKMRTGLFRLYISGVNSANILF